MNTKIENDMTKKNLHYSEITPTNLKVIFNLIATLYNRLIKNRKGKIRITLSEDSKGIEIKFRIPTVNLSSSMKALIRICVDKFIAKDNYLRIKDEDI